MLFIMLTDNAYAVTFVSGGGSDIISNRVAKDAKYGYWKMRFYVDEFKQYTSDPYLIYSKEINGTFSNSAVYNKKLTVQVVVDRDDVSLFLYEYGDQLVKGYSSSSTTYAVTMRDSSRKDHSLSATLYENGDRLIFTQISSEKIKDAFATGGSVSFYIVNNRRKVETYLFTIDDTSGFTNSWNKLNGIEPGKGTTAKVVANDVYLRDKNGASVALLPVGASVTITSYDKSRDMFCVNYKGRVGYLKGLGLSVSRETLLRTYK